MWRLSQKQYPVWKGTAVKELVPSGSRSTSQTALVHRTSRAHNKTTPSLHHEQPSSHRLSRIATLRYSWLLRQSTLPHCATLCCWHEAHSPQLCRHVTAEETSVHTWPFTLCTCSMVGRLQRQAKLE